MNKIGNWDTLPSLDFNETGTRQIFYGEKTMLAKHTIRPGFPQFAHSHPHEQILFIAEGHCWVTVGEDKFEMRSGDMVLVPSNVVHDLEVIGDETVINYDIFAPVREDFIKLFEDSQK